ncbi:MAG: transporter [Calditrichaeota bacterium]|nr:MAG: transporter [Calditrichota bacterium]
MLKKFTVFLSVLVMATTQVMASGFSIYEQGAKATAMGGAFIAQANDVSSVFYNPAGITGLSGMHLGLGTTIIIPQFAFQGPDNVDPNLYTKANDQIFPPSTFYFTYQVNEDLSLGFGFYSLFGLGSEWPDGWVGRQLATASSVQTFYLNPVVAYKIMDGLSVAAGVSAVFGQVSLGKSVYYGPRNVFGESKLEASTTGLGLNFGLQYQPNKALSIGVVYRPNTLLAFEGGDATFDFPATGDAVVDAEIATLFPNTKGSADLELPNMIGVGIAYNITDDLTAEFDWMQLGWSSYDELVIKFDDPVAGQSESVAERKYQDASSLRFGLEYRMNKELALRLGYLRDNTAIPDERVEPSLPEGTRDLYSVGFGYKVSDSMTIDGFYMLLMQADRTVTNSVDGFNGTYTGVGNLFGVNLELGL